MRKFTLYHNPRCSKSRQALALLTEEGIEPTVIDYLKNPLSTDEIKTLLLKLNIPLLELCRKKEHEFSQLALSNASQEKLFNALNTHPKLMERPIVSFGERAVIGRPTENVLSLIKESQTL